METPKSKSVEAQKEAASSRVFDLILAVNTVIDEKNNFSPKPHQYVQYGKFLNELSLYISQYSTDVNSMMSKLTLLPLMPEKAESLNHYHKEIVNIAQELRTDIGGNFDFKTNNADVVTISGRYLDYFKDSAAEVNTLTRTNESVRKVNNTLLKEKTDVEDKYLNLKQELETSEIQSKKFQTSVTELEATANKHLSDKNKVEVELAASTKELAHYKEASQKTEIARNSTNFHKQAEANKEAAKKWGIWILVTVLCFLVAIFLIFSTSGELFDMASDMVKRSKDIEPDLMKQLVMIEIIKKVSTRLIFFSMIIYSISFLVKNYNAQMHNYIINSHKANALRSTVDLIGTAKGDEGNDKIVLQAIQAIFTTQKSGYQGAESEPSSPNLITNVIDAVSSSGKKA